MDDFAASSVAERSQIIIKRSVRCSSTLRAREAREARQRRFEKRQGGGGKGCSVDVNVDDGGDERQRRVVRFEEIG